MIERKIVKAIPSSFVAANMKLASESGSGEAKLWVGQISNSAELDSFFEFNNGYSYRFIRENLLEYLQQVKIEYIYQKFNNYKNASLLTWNENYSQIKELEDADFEINLVKFTDKTRYYVRADELIFKKTFRKIAVPKLTNMIFVKNDANKEITLLLELNLEYENGVEEPLKEISYSTNCDDRGFERNRILFGAPGTGKSYTLNSDRKMLLYGDRNVDENTLDMSQYGGYERVTFHPDYSYANFVGTYKPVPKEGDEITYEFVPGPFMRVYVDALRSGRTETAKPYLLIVEEINRANVAAVFGDVFQLLDRDKNVSEYPIMPSKDVKEYLAREDVLGGNPEDYKFIKIPDNMFIWATMNSADQGVFPMDTAFKRRWDFTYLGIDDAVETMSKEIKEKKHTLGKGANARLVTWNELRTYINSVLSSEDYNINEDKLLGPYFISRSILETATTEEFIKIFKNKVIMYLFDDAVKQKKKTFFEKCKDEIKGVRYSDICNQFNEKGVFIFPGKVAEVFNVKPETSGTEGVTE